MAFVQVVITQDVVISICTTLVVRNYRSIDEKNWLLDLNVIVIISTAISLAKALLLGLYEPGTRNSLCELLKILICVSLKGNM